MPADSIQVSVLTDGVTLFNKTRVASDNTRFLFNASVATGITSLLFQVAFALDDLISCAITTDQAITLDTNAVDGTGGQVIALGAGDIIAWVSGGAQANPFTTAVTKIYITNASGFPANVQMSFIVASEV